MHNLHWETPIKRDFGQKPDISSLLQFHWFEPVYYLGDHSDHSYPSSSNEKRGCWVGVAKTKGDDHTYWILTNNTDQVKSLPVLLSALLSTRLTQTRVMTCCLHLEGGWGAQLAPQY